MSEALLTTVIVVLIGPIVLQLVKRMKPKETTADIIAGYESILKQFTEDNQRLRDENKELKLEVERLREG